MRKELPKVYEPQEVESRIYETWEKNGSSGATGTLRRSPLPSSCRPPT